MDVRTNPDFYGSNIAHFIHSAVLNGMTHPDTVRKIWPWVAGAQGEADLRMSFEGIFSMRHSALGLPVDGTGCMQNIQIAWFVTMQGSTPCLGLLKLPRCAGVLWQRTPQLSLLLDSRDVRRRSAAGGALFPFPWTYEKPTRSTKTIFTESGSGKMKGQLC